MESVKYQIKFHYDTPSIDDKLINNIRTAIKCLDEDDDICLDEIIFYSNVKVECKTIYQETKLKN